MKFRTEYTAQRAPFSLNVDKPVVLLGSCFSQNMASMMQQARWKALLPGGTLYNPVSIANVVEIFLDEEHGLESFKDSLFEYSGLWNSNLFDSSFSSCQKEDTISHFKIQRENFIEGLKEGGILIVTFGTSVCYHFREDESMVAGNCHKQPSDIFFTRRLSPEEILEVWNKTLKLLVRKFPGIKVIFTVSPVRHLKDGFHGNALSKAVLLLAIDKICFNNPDCHYFPAYEILLDDLRDYRFYASDLAHPSQEGIEYIWEKFQDTYLDSVGKMKIKEGNRLTAAAGHRPKTGALGRPLHPLK